MFETTPRNKVGSRRAARIVFGSVLIAGAAGMLVNMRANALLAHDGYVDGSRTGLTSLGILLVSWVLALLIGGLVSNVKIEDGSGLRTASLVIPSIGVALMLPLLIHVPFTGGDSNAFESWAGLSVVAVGFAHVVLAVLMAVRAWRLVNGKTGPSVGAVYGVTVLAACVPWGMFILPELIVAITGLPFLAVLYLQETIARRERDDERLDDIPVAVASFRAAI